MTIRVFGRALGIAALASLAATSVHAETISQALASAYAKNPQIVSAILGAKIQAENIAAAKAGTRPRIGASANITDTWSVTGGTNVGTTALSLTYNQVIFDSNATNAQIEAARAGAIAQAEAARSTEQDVLLSAAQAYVNVVRDTRLVQLRSENIKFYQAQVRSAQDRLNIGEGTKISLAQAQAGLAQGIAAYQSAISSLQLSQATFARYMGHSPKNLALSFPYDRLMPKSLDDGVAIAEREHPALRAAEAQIRASKASLDAAQSSFGPTVSLSGSLTQSQNLTYGSSNVGGQIGVTLSVPLYAGGALGAAERKANLTQIKSEVDARNIRDQISTAVISAWTGIRSAAASIAAITSSENASQQALNGVIEEQKVGQATTLDVLNSRSTLTDVQVSKITAQANKVSAEFGLLAAIGRMTAEDLQLAVTIQSADGYRAKVEDIWQDLRSVPGE